MIFWLQSGLTLFALLLIFWFVLETIPVKKSTQLEGPPRSRYLFKVLSWINPMLVLKLQRYPNLSLTVRRQVEIPIVQSLLVLTGYLEPCRRCYQLEHVCATHGHSACTESPLPSYQPITSWPLLPRARSWLSFWLCPRCKLDLSVFINLLHADIPLLGPLRGPYRQ